MEYLDNPVTLNIGDQDNLHANRAITQHIHMLAPHEKYDKLEELLETLTVEASAKKEAARAGQDGVATELIDEVPYNPKNVPKTLIFVGKKADCDDIAYDIQDAGYAVGTLHGDKSQDARSFIMQQFRRNNIKVLVATDVAARGLDITDIECVINFDFPPGKSSGIEDYVHRIGRTARGNRSGVAHSFFTPADSHMAKDLVGVLERAGQEVPNELRKLGNPRRMQTKRNYRDNSGRGGTNKRVENFDFIGGKRGKSSRNRQGQTGGYKPHPKSGSFLNSNSMDWEKENSYDEDSFYRSGGFKVGNKKFGGDGYQTYNRGGKKPKYKSIHDDDDYF